MVFQGIGHQNSYLAQEMVKPFRDNYGNVPAIIDGQYWSVFNTQEQNVSAKYPRLSSVTEDNNYATSSYWLFNGAYFRMKNITLGYTFPDKWMRKAKIQIS